MKKCDFCSEQSYKDGCYGRVGSPECIEATKAFREYMLASVRSSKEKTININKTQKH